MSCMIVIYFQGSYIKHEKTDLCLDLDEHGPVMNKCNPDLKSQLWQFTVYIV